jgi:transposase-like protein
VPQLDRAIAIDETFLNIEGKKVYIIIATGYTSRKVLGIKVSFSRKIHDMWEVFDEAECNTKYMIATVISDTWSSTISMVKNLFIIPFFTWCTSITHRTRLGLVGFLKIT